MPPEDFDKTMENVALDEDFVHDQLPSVEDYKLNHPPKRSSYKKLKLGIALGVMLLIVVLGTMVCVLINNAVSRPTRLQQVLEFVREHSTTDAVTVQGSPQRKAAYWMSEVDEKQLSLNKRFLQRYALMVLFYATGGETTWVYDLNFGHPKRDECNWRHDFNAVNGRKIHMGVSCDPSNRVNEIVIEDNGLSGSIPPEIGLLTVLDGLVLKTNALTGSLPSALKLLSNLDELNLAGNVIGSTIPTWIAELTNLIDLSLSHNELVSTIPVELKALTKLETLALQKNYMTGNLTVLNDVPSLENVHVGENAFTGLVDNFFLSALTNAVVLDLSGNALEGQVARALLRRPKLQRLDLHGNRLSGVLPDIPHTTSLEFLALYDNQLSGPIPDSIVSLSSLRHLDLSNNRFVDALPTSIGHLTNLEVLLVGSNYRLLPGPIPPTFQQLTNLKEFSVALSRRTGPIPAWIGGLTSLDVLDLSSNEFEGRVPAALKNLTNLEFLLLSKNKLTGELPASLMALSDLAVVALNNNTLTGSAWPLCGNPRDTFVADCAGNDPEIVCSCCTKCCSDDMERCGADVVLPLLEGRYEKHYDQVDD